MGGLAVSSVEKLRLGRDSRHTVGRSASTTWTESSVGRHPCVKSSSARLAMLNIGLQADSVAVL